MQKLVSFWVFEDGRWQGIRLSPGDTVILGTSGQTDEGWSSWHVEYSLELGEDDTWSVLCSSYSDGRDCDGRMSTEWHGYCPEAELERLPADEYGPARPAWRERSRRQRDYSAESMGY